MAGKAQRLGDAPRPAAVAGDRGTHAGRGLTLDRQKTPSLSGRIPFRRPASSRRWGCPRPAPGPSAVLRCGRRRPGFAVRFLVKAQDQTAVGKPANRRAAIIIGGDRARRGPRPAQIVRLDEPRAEAFVAAGGARFLFQGEEIAQQAPEASWTIEGSRSSSGPSKRVRAFVHVRPSSGGKRTIDPSALRPTLVGAVRHGRRRHKKRTSAVRR